MMRHLCLLLMTYAALTLDAGSSRWAMPEGTAPQFLFMTAGIALLLCEGAGATFWAAIIGVLTDAITRGPMGLNVVLLSNLVFFGQIFGTRSVRGSIFASGAAVWMFVTLASFSSLLLRQVLFGEPIDLRYLTQYAAGRAGGSVVILMSFLIGWRLVSGSLRFVLPSNRVGKDRRRWAGAEA